MINALVKFLSSFVVVASFFASLTTQDLYFHLGCYASIIFGITLQLSIIRRTQPLTVSFVVWHIITTLAICWGAFLFWTAKQYGYSMWFMFYLFLVSFCAVIILNTAQKLASIGIPKGARMLMTQWLGSNDKEEETK